MLVRARRRSFVKKVIAAAVNSTPLGDGLASDGPEDVEGDTMQAAL